MELEQIIFIGGIVSYFLMRNQLRKVYSQEYVKSIKGAFSIPILQIVSFAIFLYQEGADAVKSAGKIDGLHNISTYTPFLGDLGKIADIANQSGLLPDIERSQGTLEFIKAAGTANQYVGIGMFVVIALALAELYGVFRLGKFTQKQMQLFYIGISVTFVICGFLLGVYLEKYTAVLSSVFSGVDNNIPWSLIFSTTTLLLWGICYMPYSKSLNKLFNTNNNQEVELTANSTEDISKAKEIAENVPNANRQSEAVKSQDETITPSDIQENT